MKKRARNVLSLLLGVVLLLSALPVTAAGSTELYRWTATTVEKDSKAMFSNLVTGTQGKVRWNETGTIYTAQGEGEIVLHTFLNETVKQGKTTYGVPEGTGLCVEMFPTIDTTGFKAVGLSFVYGYKPGEKGLNPANSGRLQVSLSSNGMDWAQASVGVRSAQIIGSGTTKSGEPVIYYQINSDDLLKIADKYIHGIRILPDGISGGGNGTFSLSQITVTGYKSKADFTAAVPAPATQSAGYADSDACRKVMLDAARNSTATSELGKVVDALSLVLPLVPATATELLHSTQVLPMDGIATQAADSIKELFAAMYERHLMTPEREAQILAEYEAINTTDDIVKDLNTPQMIMRAYAKAKASDVLLQVTDAESHVHMVVKSEPVYLLDRVNVNPLESKITYLTLEGETTQTFYDVYMQNGFLPMTVDALEKGTVPLSELDVHVTVADGVRVSAVSNMTLADCRITLGSTVVTMEDINAKALVCSDEKLSAAVAALADGKHQMTMTATDCFGSKIARSIELEVKDGKAAVLGVTVADHAQTCPAKAMTDVDKNAWYHEAVDYALANGIMGGYNATTFGPNDTLSRAMVVQVLYNKEGKPAISGKHTFADVPADQWFNNAVTWGTSNGVMSGYNATTFGPNDEVTVEQIAVILHNYSGKPAFTGKADSVGQHSSWAADGLAWALENGILDNVPYENVTAGATRAQTAQMLMNYLKNN